MFPVPLFLFQALRLVLMPLGGVTLLQLAGHILYAKALAGEEDDEVVEHVGALVDEAVVGAIGGLDDGLEGLLAHLLCHAVQTVAEEAGGVAALGHLLVATLDEVLELAEEGERRRLVGLAPAGVGAEMTGRTVGDGLDEQGIAIAVDGNTLQVEQVAGRLALRPKGLTAAAEEGDEAGGEGLLVGLTVHITKHEDTTCAVVLDDGGHEAAHLLKIYFFRHVVNSYTC